MLQKIWLLRKSTDYSNLNQPWLCILRWNWSSFRLEFGVTSQTPKIIIGIIHKMAEDGDAKLFTTPQRDTTPSAKAAATIIHNNEIPSPTYFAYWSTFPSHHPVFSHSFMCSVVLGLIATGTLPLLQSTIQPYLSFLSLLVLRLVFISTAIISLLHQSGALRRYVIKFAEAEVSKVLNGALVTLSDAQVDLWRGKVVVHDFLIHNKDRGTWKWDSPCLVRVGRIEASLNFASVIQLPHIGRILNHNFFDIYTVLVEDVQVFAEKRKSVFNFHLLDASLDIPDHEPIMNEYNKRKERDALLETVNNKLDATKSQGLDTEEQRGDAASGRDVISPLREKEDEANKIIEKLVGTVSNLGKAAGEGGSKGLKAAVITHKDSWVKNLKELHSKSPASSFASRQGSDFKEDWSRQKNKMKSLGNALGKVVEQNVSDIKHQMAFLQQPPPKKEGWPSSPPEYIRVGSFMLREGRIFTKDVLVGKGEETTTELPEKDNMDRHISGWSRPIVIFELSLTSAEMSPSMSARDPNTGMPVVGIPMDRFLDIIMKKLMAEVAKYNTGRLFQTAFGDVFSFVDANATKELVVEGDS